MMPVRIPDSELRRRLEGHGYNVPPITDTTRNVLIKKLEKLDKESTTANNKRTIGAASSRPGYSLADYSSAEEDAIPPPRASSTRKGGSTSQTSHHRRIGNDRQQDKSNNSQNSRLRPSHTVGRNISRATTNFPPGIQTRNGTSSRGVSLMCNSEEEDDDDDEDGEEEEEEEEDDVEDDDEEDDDDDDDELVDDDEVEDGRDRVDFGIQTSLGNSTVNASSPVLRFRGQRVPSSHQTPNNSGGGLMSGRLSGPATSSASVSASGSATKMAGGPRTIMSPHLRKNLNKFGSLDEALSTLPTINNAKNTTNLSVSLGPEVIGSGSNNSSTGQLITTQAAPSSQGTKFSNQQQYYTNRGNTTKNWMNSVRISRVLLYSFVVFLLVILYIYVNLKPGGSCQVVEGEASSDANEICLKEEGSIMSWLSDVVSSAFLLLWSWIEYLVYIAIVLLIGWMGYKGYRKYADWKIKEKQEVFQLIEQVLVLLQQHQSAVRDGGKGGPTYLAVLHVRDHLIPPNERSNKAKVWDKVVKYIRTQESRVREDIQCIAGEEFRVWQWLTDISTSWSPGLNASHGRRILAAGGRHLSPSAVSTPKLGRPTPPSPKFAANGEGGLSPIASTLSSVSSTSSSSARMAAVNDPWPHVSTSTITAPGSSNWQGSALDSDRPQPPPPTSCVKVRHMFRREDRECRDVNWVNNLKNDIIKRCEDARILHIVVDSKSDEGVVYIKTMSNSDAGKVFRCLDGQWYKGELLMAKFLKLERYHERAPESRHATVPLRPRS